MLLVCFVLQVSSSDLFIRWCWENPSHWMTWSQWYVPPLPFQPFLLFKGAIEILYGLLLQITWINTYNTIKKMKDLSSGLDECSMWLRKPVWKTGLWTGTLASMCVFAQASSQSFYRPAPMPFHSAHISVWNRQAHRQIILRWAGGTSKTGINIGRWSGNNINT